MIRQKITINIDARWGSDFQREISTKALDVLLKSWYRFYSLSHKDNLINQNIKIK